MRSFSICPMAFAALLFAPPGPSFASEPGPNSAAAVDLLSGDARAQWSPAIGTAQGWQVADGKLYGAAGASPLRYASLPRDFELHMTWSVADDGAVILKLPAMATEYVAELHLSEEDGITIRLPETARKLKIPEQSRGGAHVMRVRRSGGALRVSIDGAKSRALPIEPDAQFALSLAVAAGTATIESLQVVEADGSGEIEPSTAPANIDPAPE